MPPPADTGLAYTPPDGQWGWAVVFGAFISIGFSYAFPKGIAIFFKEIQDFFGTSYSEIAWVSSIMLAATYGGGKNNENGGNIPLFYSLTVGLGLALNLQPSVIIIGKYFLKRRPIANGLAMAGSPVMLCTLAPLNQFLFDTFGWRGSFFILGALLLNCCVAGALFRPIGPTSERQKNKEAKGAVREKTDGGIAEIGEKNMETKEDRDCCENFNKFLDLSLFKHRGFLIYLIGNVLMFLGFFAPIVFLAPYAKHRGIDEYSAAFLLSILAIVDMIARPATGLLANSKWVRPRIQYFFSFSIAFNGVCHLLCPLATSYMGLVIYSIFFGLAFGMVCAMLFETLMDLVGASRFTSAVGLVTIVECCTILLGPPIGGTLIDTFGDYKYMFIKCGAVMVLAGTFLFVMNYYNYRMLAKEEKKRMKEDGEKKDNEDARTKEGERNVKAVEKIQDVNETALKKEENGLKNGANLPTEP
ncbi:monocarboxylate transporter 2-like [Notechis scutatus]|uniref:Monocarboxylate transporter 2-like n=1 Tax=Notechis scutatus TaxID=8663 RepID=A0A6J1UPV9_9SAUR|nr:monocarboxylate transporter 2-like [Notechis scutatus]